MCFFVAVLVVVSSTSNGIAISSGSSSGADAAKVEIN
jgi:hypothetical protein